MLPRGTKKCKSPAAIRKKSLLRRKSPILSIRWIFPFSEGWGGSLTKKCKSLGAIRKKSLLSRKSAILSIRCIFPFSEGWGGSLKKLLILVQRPQHKGTSDPVAAPKNNTFGVIFIEFGDTKKCCTFSGLELVPKRRKKLIAALSCMRKGPKCIQTLWDHPKKISFVQNYKEIAICDILREKTHFEAFPDPKKLIAALSCMHKGPRYIQTLWDHPKKIPFVQKYKEIAICDILRGKNPF